MHPNTKPTNVALVICMVILGIGEENAGNRPYFALTRTAGQAPEFPFMGVNDVMGQMPWGENKGRAAAR